MPPYANHAPYVDLTRRLPFKPNVPGVGTKPAEQPDTYGPVSANNGTMPTPQASGQTGSGDFFGFLDTMKSRGYLGSGGSTTTFPAWTPDTSTVPSAGHVQH